SDKSRYFLLWGWGTLLALPGQYITLYGVGTDVSGSILHFTPFVVGGIISWVLASSPVWFGMDKQISFASASIYHVTSFQDIY
ncbi:MAG: hypothetical protein WKF89_16925, partial [Chitinophagaceae bacterium]